MYIRKKAEVAHIYKVPAEIYLADGWWFLAGGGFNFACGLFFAPCYLFGTACLGLSLWFFLLGRAIRRIDREWIERLKKSYVFLN